MSYCKTSNNLTTLLSLPSALVFMATSLPHLAIRYMFTTHLRPTLSSKTPNP